MQQDARTGLQLRSLVKLVDALNLEHIANYVKSATGQKYLVTRNKDAAGSREAR
jgi:hypothetical protein